MVFKRYTERDLTARFQVHHAVISSGAASPNSEEIQAPPEMSKI